MNSAWKKLSLVGEIQYLEIVSAEILPFSKGLEEHGIKVIECVPHIMETHEHNEQYLKTKAERLGHTLDG